MLGKQVGCFRKRIGRYEYLLDLVKLINQDFEVLNRVFTQPAMLCDKVGPCTAYYQQHQQVGVNEVT